MLHTLVQEIREMKVQLGVLVADFAAKQEPAGSRVSISEGPCRMCYSHSGMGREQNNDFDTTSTCSGYDESQLP